MNALFPEEETELEILVCKESDRYLINETIIKYPVTWEIIEEMILRGLSAIKIQTFCNEVYFNGKIVSDSWDKIKHMDAV